MREAVARFNSETSKGKLYPLTLNHRGKRVGRIVRQDVIPHDGNPTVTEDVLITEPETQQRWLRGELPEISADIDLANPEIFATSLLETGEGHFGHGTIGQVYPESLAVAFAGEGHKVEQVLCLMAEAAKEKSVEIDDIKKLLADNNKEILKNVEETINNMIDGKLELAKKANTDPLDPQNDVVRERERANVLIKAEQDKYALELSKEQDIGKKLAEAAKVDVGLNLKAYEAQLRQRDQQARDDYHRLCLERARNSRVSIQPTDDPSKRGKPSEILELEAEFDADAENWKKLGVPKEKFVSDVMRKRAQRKLRAIQAGV